MTALPPVVLAVDAGTGSTRTIAFSQDGTLMAQATREWSHAPTPGHPGGVDFDTEHGWALVADAIRDVVDAVAGREILAVGASSMREGFVLYDEHGEEIFACPNTDGRSRHQADELVRRGVADRVYALAGDWVSITAPARFLWIEQERPELLRRARHLGMLSDWVTYRLTGEFTTDPTCGSSSALFDLAARGWSAELTEVVGLRPEVLPPVLECGTVAGYVRESAAEATGLPAGTPVVVGGADTQLALHGIGASSEAPTVVAGTFWQTAILADSPLIDSQRRMRTLCHVDPGTWMVEGISFLSGLAMRWFRDAFCPDAVASATQTGSSAFSVMEGWAESVPAGSNGLVAVLSNVMQADAWHHASPAFVDFDITRPEAFHRGTFVRAIEEAAGYVVRAHLEILDDIADGAALGNGRLTMAGGSSTGALWPSIISDITGLTVGLSQVSEATSFGAARLAASAVGMEIAPAAERSRHIAPDPVASLHYEDHYRHWADVYRAQTRASQEAGLTPLFVPPGGLGHVSGSPASSTKEKERING